MHSFSISIRSLTLAVLCLCTADAALAQIGYPGQYPGGSPYPGGGGGRFPGGRRGRTDPSDTKGRKGKDPVPTVITTGMLRTVAGNKFVMEADDHRIITYSMASAAKVLKDSKPIELSSLSKGDHISVDSSSDEDGNFTAVEVRYSSAGTPEDRALAARTWDLPTLTATSGKPASAQSSGRDADDDRPVMRRSPASDTDKSKDKSDNNKSADKNSDKKDDPQTAQAETEDSRPKTTVRPNDIPLDPDDSGAPRLRRGPPSARASKGPDTATNTERDTSTHSTETRTASPPSTKSEPSVQAAVKPPAEPSDAIRIEEDPIIVKAKTAAEEYGNTLPNFLVKQSTTRYDSDNPKSGWTAQDVVTADVAYKDGAQTYKNVMVGTRSVKSIEDTGGNWSTGEFATWLQDVFDPSTAARFRRSGTETLRGRPSTIFKYEVTRENSHWRVITTGQLYYPAYRGSIWIDRDTSRVLRLEVESRNIPPLFPVEKVEMALDYDFVRLSARNPFLVPTVAEVLDCFQGTTRCSRNRIEFRNYRKFGAESDVTYDENTDKQ